MNDSISRPLVTPKSTDKEQLVTSNSKPIDKRSANKKEITCDV